ncbi:hypothetical protein LXA43DRAFT_659735 [Ganoderma leucocontextum]|nr:hypothetical protein LXA43DRAFT_659735 [Ganoderma leucocontextum]
MSIGPTQSRSRHGTGQGRLTASDAEVDVRRLGAGRQRMPRLIPRLLRNLQHAHTRSPKFPPQPITKSNVDDTRSIRDFARPEEVDISPTGRTQSILLDRRTLRLIYRHARYQREKALAPEVRVSRSRWVVKQRCGRAPRGVMPREMTQEERSFHANPYLRMLASPLRQCYESGWTLPRDLMIRMSPAIIPGDTTKTTFLPSGIEHPAFRPFRGGKSKYLLCWKPVLERALKTGAYRRFTPESSSQMTMHPLVIDQVSHSLRVRVLHELHLLARQLRRVQQPMVPPVVRRLTRAEWSEIKSTGVVPFKNAVAVLVVPPPNRDPETKQRPVPNYSSIPVEGDRYDSTPLVLSEMHPTAPQEDWELVDEQRVLPPKRIPVYNGVPLFPSRTQRAALCAALAEVLRAEGMARLRHGSQCAEGTVEHSTTTEEGGQRAKGDQKASHAILVCSDEQTLFRGDTVPLAIALWRIRIWEQGLEDNHEQHFTSSWTGAIPRTSTP